MKFPTIKRGSTGQWVRYLQDLLMRNGHFDIIIDGSFGPATEAAVKKTQEELHILADGIVTEHVWEAFSKTVKAEGRICEIPMVTESIIPITKGKRTGAIQEAIEWIVAHNTANPKSTAIGERGWLVNLSNDRSASWHYAVDQIHALLAIPEDEVAYHASDYTANRTSIGVESCESGDLEKVWDNTVGLIAMLLFNHQLGIERLTTHNRWNGKNCPRLLLPKWVQFVADVKATLEFLTRQANGEPEPVPEPEPIPEPPDEEIEPDPIDDEDIDIGLINRILLIIEKLLLRLLGR
jgi:N-acetylmuramoyl-L-alanine amidase